MSDKQAEITKEDLPIYTCFDCGPQKPGEPVFQCTICTQSFCAAHINPSLHPCAEKPE